MIWALGIAARAYMAFAWAVCALICVLMVTSPIWALALVLWGPR